MPTVFQKDDEIQRSFPKPIAAVYSKAINAVEPRSRVDYSLRLFEVAMQYLALTGVARLRDYEGADRDQLRSRLAGHLRRPKLGNWVGAVRELDAAFLKTDRSLAGVRLNARRPDMAHFQRVLKALEPGNGGTKTNLAEIFERLTSLRNHVQHRICPQALLRDSDLLLNAVRELLQTIPFFREKVLVHARMVAPRRRDYEVRLVAFMGDGGPKPLDEIRSLPHQLIQNYLYLYDPQNQRFSEVSPFLQTEGDDILCFAGLDGSGEALFACPYVSIDPGNLLDACRDLHDCAPYLFEPEPGSIEQLRHIVECAAVDGVIHPDELAILRRSAIDLGLATDERSAAAVADLAIQRFGGTAAATDSPAASATGGDFSSSMPPTQVARGAFGRTLTDAPPALERTEHIAGSPSERLIPGAEQKQIPSAAGEYTVGATDTTAAARDASTALRHPAGAVAIPSKPRHRFVGRAKLLSALRVQLFGGESVALTGHPGVGKTAIAVELAHDPDVLRRFQDNILWIELGPDPDRLTLLGDLGDSLGIPAEVLADLQTVDARAGAINTAIGDRPFLIVVDDAWTLDDAVEFRLGNDHCAHLLTTRFLPVAHGFANVQPEKVPEFDPAEGLQLLEQFVPEVVRSEPDIAQELIQLVGSLPLSVVLLGHHLRIRTAGRPKGLFRSEVTKLLKDSRERLALHQSDNRHSSDLSLNAVAKMSVASLGSGAARALAMLCVLPPKPSTFSEAAAAAVSAEPVESIFELVDAGLLEFIEPDRLGLNRVLVDYLSSTSDTQMLADAKRRMSLFYFGLLDANSSDTVILEQEHSNVLASIRQATELDLYGEMVRAVNSFWPSMERQGLFKLAHELLREARVSAESLVDESVLRDVLLTQGANAFARGSYSEAEGALRECLERSVGADERMRGAVNHRLGAVCFSLNRVEEADGHLQTALALARSCHDPDQLIDVLNSLGMLEDIRGDYSKAEGYFREGLAIARVNQQDVRYCNLLVHLGWVTAHLGNFEGAQQMWEQGLGLARRSKHRPNLAHALSVVGWVLDRRGNTAAAEKLLLEGLAVARSSGHMHLISTLLTNLGALHIHRGDFGIARRLLDEGFDIVLQIGHEERRAVLVENLGLIDCRQGLFDEAERRFLEGIQLANGRVKERISALQTYLGEIATMRGDLESASGLLASALDLAQELGNGERIAVARRHLGRLELARKREDHASEHLEAALELAGRLDYRWLVGAVLGDLGALFAPVNAELSFDRFSRARAVAEEISSGDLRATALLGLSRHAAQAGDVQLAASLARESFGYFESVGAYETRDARALLLSLSAGTPGRR